MKYLSDCCEIVCFGFIVGPVLPPQTQSDTPSEISPTPSDARAHNLKPENTIASGIEANKPPNRLKTHTAHSDCVFIFSSFHDFRV